MAVTLRQLQRWLHASQKNAHAAFGDGDNADDIGQFAGWLRGDDTQAAWVYRGALTKTCSCEECTRVPLVDSRVVSLVDSLAKKHGADTPLQSLMQQSAPEGFEAPNEDGDEGEEQGDEDEDGGGEGQGQGDGEDTDDTSDGDSSSGNGSESEASNKAPPKPRDPEQARKDRAQEATQEAKKKLQAAQDDAKARPHSSVAAQQVRRAKRQLKDARAAASVAKNDGPSLKVRRRISTAHGRLRGVSPTLRAEMAALINLLVGQGAAAGGQAAPIPVLSPRKLVTRMLSRRPLANALKEDIVTGRPVTLFMPDISPSCAVSAQAACDVANAAGYAGVTGSDVLVFPHSNGCVNDEYGDEYVPWFNGKPFTTDRKEIARLFAAVTSGNSRWRVRAVVIIGDHDGEELYHQIAALRQIARMVWLHNDPGLDRSLCVADEADCKLYGWKPESVRKVSLVYGCTTQRHMVKGMRVALQDH